MGEEFEILEENQKLSEALKILNSYKKVIIVNGEGKLKGSLTDGDVRRWLLKAGDLSAQCSQVCNSEPCTASTYSEAREKAKKMKVEYIIKINDENFPIGIFDAKASPQLPENTYCLLMAGGKGSRLRPLTLTTPKPLVEVGGQPMIDFTLKKLAREGIKDVFLSVCYLKEKFYDYIGSGSNYGLNVHFVEENAPLGTAGSIKSCLEKLDSNARLLVANGDVMLNSHFTLFSDYHLEQKADVTVVSKTHEMVNPYGVLTIEDGRIIDIVEKPTYRSYVSAGIYLFDVGRLKHAFMDIEGYIDMPQLIVKMCGSGSKVVCYPIHEEWHDLGTIAQLEDFEKKMDSYKFL